MGKPPKKLQEAEATPEATPVPVETPEDPTPVFEPTEPEPIVPNVSPEDPPKEIDPYVTQPVD